MYRNYIKEQNIIKMSEKLVIGLVIGSTREGRLAERVATFVKNAISKDHKVVVFDPLEMDLPLTQQSMNFVFNPTAVPQNIKDLNEKFSKVDALVLVCGEYNYSIPPALTNMLDNIPPTTLAYKPVAYVSYSMSHLGGARSAMQLRQFTGALGLIPVPVNMCIPTAHEAVDENGKPKDDKLNGTMELVLQHVYWTSSALKAQAAKTPAPKWIPN